MSTNSHSVVAQANRIASKLARIEVGGSYAPDLRNLMRDERMTLHVRREKAMKTGATREDIEKLSAACSESERVMRMWDVW